VKMASHECMRCKNYKHWAHSKWIGKLTGECKIRGATVTKTGKPITPVSEEDYIAFFLEDGVGRLDQCETFKLKGRSWGRLEPNIVGAFTAAAD